MTSGAACLTQAPDELYWNFITVSGTIQWLDSPCEEGEECPPCVTPAIVTSDKTYYLSSSNQEVRDFLDRIELAPIPAIYLLPLQARASGTPYTQGSFDFLVVSNIDDLYVQYFSDQQENKLPSLCDEWNVWYESFESFGPISFDKVVKYQLTTDTLITGQKYVKLTSDKDSPYLGAMREGNNRDIYYVPEGSTNEFLLYAFNAQVGEVLNDLYLGGFEENGYSGRVEAISDSSPRLFTIRVLYPDGMGVEPGESFSVTWIEGVGSPETPYGLAVVPTVPAEVGIYTLLCAYKNGEQIYVSEMGAEYGCEHDQTPEPTDTIPLYYTGDDPGSSTVDPVDPNQVVATLKGNQLTIHENMGTDITYTLQRNAPAQAPAIHNAPKSDTFRDEVTIQITESGEYLLQLTNPSWDYIIYGQFYYAPQGIDHITNEPSPITTKVIKNGQIYILRGDIVYTIDGREVK
jgi:hypothetical protein